MLNLQLLREIFEEPSPCDNCKSFNDCKTMRLACTEFAVYVNSGMVLPNIKPMPNSYIYNKVMSTSDSYNGAAVISAAFNKYQRNKAEGKYGHFTE